MSSSCCSRRSFVRTTAVAGLAGTSGLALSACQTDALAEEESAPATHEGFTWETLVSAEDLPVGQTGRAQAGEHELLLYRASEEEVHVFSNVCTHEGCAVDAQEDRFHCPCHGSVYQLEDGVPYGGPAREPLTRFTAEIDEGEIRVLV